MAQKKHRREEDNEEQVQHQDPLQQAVQYGIGVLSHENPGIAHLLPDYLDPKKIDQYIKSKSNLKIVTKSGEKKQVDPQLLYEDVAKFVASGKALTSQGQRLVLEEGLEKKTKMSKDMRENIDTFKKIYQLMASGNYAQHDAEFRSYVAEMYDAEFLVGTIKLLRAKGVMDNTKYKAMMEALDYKLKDRKKHIMSKLEHHVGYDTMHKAAAIIVGIAGTATIAMSGTTLTGNVIGSASSSLNVLGLASGLAMILISFLIMFEPR